ncbi:MAG: hypothetical protein JXR94_11135 [Candidatus Hydrogenedentes bacterium]|nr:hypothetical protein [Candidatus Hydrogenedentota bacterium]
MGYTVTNLTSKQLSTRICLVVAYLSFRLAHALELQDVKDVYAHKYNYLRSFRTSYSVTRDAYTLEGQRIRQTTKVYEDYGQGLNAGRRLALVDVQRDQVVPISWTVQVGDLSQKLSLSDVGPPTHVKIKQVDRAEAYQLHVYSPIALMGLHSAALEDDRSAFIQHTQTTDLLSCLNEPGVTLLPETEEIAGHDCYVVELSFFKAWLAADMDLALVKRETYAIRSPSEKYVAFRVQCADFREFAPGMFFPQEMIVDCDKEAVRERGEFSVERYKLLSIEFNPEIPEDEFWTQPPKGILAEDESSGVEFIVGEAATLDDLFDADAEFVEAAVARPVAEREGQVAPPSPAVRPGTNKGRAKDAKLSLATGLLAVGVAVTLLAVGYGSIRRLRSRPGK